MEGTSLRRVEETMRDAEDNMINKGQGHKADMETMEMIKTIETMESIEMTEMMEAMEKMETIGLGDKKQEDKNKKLIRT